MLRVIKTLLMFVVLILSGYFMISGVTYFDYKIIGKVKRDGVAYINTGSTLDEQVKMLVDSGFVAISADIFNVASRLDRGSFRAGRYTLERGMTYSQLFNMLGGGSQTAAKVVFNNVYDMESLSGKITANLEIDSTTMLRALRDDTLLNRLGLTTESVQYIFIPNTYDVYWNSTPEQVIAKMKREYDLFWSNSQRKERLKVLGMSKEEVITLAAIVDAETNIDNDMKTIAGVYINRLNRKMALQSCPTVIFAHNDRSIKRVLDRHLEIDSPYNTYKYLGLPPSPILIPSIAAIDAVLNYRESNYLYFCASEKLDGTHIFTSSFAEHKRNAQRYARMMNKAKIYN